MKQDDPMLRERLRAADPAAGVELSHLERARIRAKVLEAARARRAEWPWPMAVRWGVVGVLLAAVVLVSLRGRTPVPADSAERTIPAQTVAPEISPEPIATRPALAHREAPARTRPRPRQKPAEGAPATRIVFTAPEGTRIFWFGAATPVKEDAT